MYEIWFRDFYCFFNKISMKTHGEMKNIKILFCNYKKLKLFTEKIYL
jgi:hypothetical protein